MAWDVAGNIKGPTGPQGGGFLRVGTAISSTAPAINTDNYDMFGLTAQTDDITGFTMSGSPVDGQMLWIYIIGAHTCAVVWGDHFESGPVTLPGATTGIQRLDVGFVWNASTSKWRCVAAGSG